MTLVENVKWLLDNDYLLVVDSTPCLTSKFYKELGYKETVLTKPAAKEEPKEVVISKKVTSTEKKDIWNKFIEDADIPWRVKATDGGVYTVRQYNLAAANKLIAIIKNKEIDYDRLIASTKNYYKTVSYKVLLSKYLLNDLWLTEYKEFGKSSSSSGENVFED